MHFEMARKPASVPCAMFSYSPRVVALTALSAPGAFGTNKLLAQTTGSRYLYMPMYTQSLAGMIMLTDQRTLVAHLIREHFDNEGCRVQRSLSLYNGKPEEYSGRTREDRFEEQQRWAWT